MENLVETAKRNLLAVGKDAWLGISEETGVPFHTLRKIAHSRSSNPTASTLQPILDWFEQKAAQAAAASPPTQQ